jgi:hypothetical protein
MLCVSLIKFHKKPVQLVKKPCKEWKEKAQSVPNMTSSNNEPTFLDMNDLCDASLEALIQHYLSVKQKLPDSVSVRERLLELQDELFKRRTTHYDSN